MDQIKKKSLSKIYNAENDIKEFTVVSLFSGAGGMDLGFSKARFKTIWASDIDEIALKTFFKHFKCKTIKRDIRELSPDEIPDDPDVIIGGFPCQGFSSAGKRNIFDERNSLAWEMIRIIKVKKPKFIVGENVLGIRSMKHPDGGLVIDRIIKDLNNIGYDSDYKVLNARDYGVAQSRKRIFIIGNRLNLPNFFPKPTHNKNNWKTLGELLSDLPNPDLKDNNNDFKNHVHKPLSPSDLEIVKYILPGKNWKSVPYEKLNSRLKKIKDNIKFYKSPAFYKRPLFSEPTGTVSAQMNPTHCTALHPTENRRFTVREAARIQSFPDEFDFIGTISQCYKQVGNAVPPKLAYRIAKTIRSQLINFTELKSKNHKITHFL